MDGAQGIPTDVVRSLAGGLKRSTLEYWIKSGLVAPGVRPDAEDEGRIGGSRGNRYVRYWELQEAVAVRMIKALRDAGCPLQRIRDAKDYLENVWSQALSSSVLVWDGNDLFNIGAWDEVESVWRRPGQLAFKALAMPVGEWREEAEQYMTEIPAG